VIVAFTVYCWFLRLYPGSYRDEFGDEMTSVFRDAQSTLPPALAAKLSFYRREFCGLISGALRARFECLLGPAVPLWRLHMQPQVRFPRSIVFLMLVIFAGVVLTIAEAASVAGDTVGWGWRTPVFLLVFMILSMCTAAALVWRILHTLRRSGVHRLQNLN
jgi:hypothetical protein